VHIWSSIGAGRTSNAMIETIRQVVRVLSVRWPEHWGALIADDGVSAVMGHPLERQLSALLSGRAASFPYPVSNEGDTTWVTMAPDAACLQSAIEDLRAWLLPSYGWEDCIKTAPTAGNTLSAQILSLSPAGYFRWKTRAVDTEIALRKLNSRLRLEDARPAHVLFTTPSLIELRQRFETSLVARDRESALSTIVTIDSHGLDTATNTRFMKVRLYDRFSEYGYVADETSVRDLLSVRMPHLIRVCLARAFYAHFLAASETTRGLRGTMPVFSEQVYPLLAGLLARCHPEDGPDVRRLLGYRAMLTGDRAAAPVVADGTDDAALIEFLAELLVRPAAADEHDSPAVVARATPPAPLPGASSEDREVRSWKECVAAIGDSLWSAVARFLASDDRPSLSESPVGAVLAVLDSLEGLLTDPEFDQRREAQQLLLSCLVQVIGDIRLDRDFPRNDHLEIYLRLHQLWVHQRKGSTHREDLALFLVLADAALAAPHAEAAVVHGIEEWWSMRKGRPLLPFLLEALSLVSYYPDAAVGATNLWIDGATCVHRDPGDLTRGERQAWRSLGLRLGVDEASVEDFLRGADPSDEPERDPLADSGLGRVAIVSFRERQANEAASEIRKRSGADVIIVGKGDGGMGMIAARAADVVLIVWAAISHEVYRGFDTVREKVAYVQGTGAESIVLALEREVVKRASRAHR